MKVIIALIFVVAASFCASDARYLAPNGVDLDNLYKDFEDFKNILPLEKLHEIYEKHLKHDPEFQKTLNFLKSRKMQLIAFYIMNSDEIDAIKRFLSKEGWLTNPEFRSSFRDIEGGEYNEIDAQFRSFGAELLAKGLENFIDEILSALPKAQLSKLVKEKLATSPDFRAFFNLVTGPEMKKLTDALLNSSDLKGQWNTLARNGIDVKKLDQKIRAFIKQLL